MMRGQTPGRWGRLRQTLGQAFALCLTGGLLPPAQAAEGMWPLDQLPTATLAQEYDFKPDTAFLQRLQGASLRMDGGCSASFVSADGLVLSNHHCLQRCLAQLSGESRNLLEDGFLAESLDEEKICPELELNRLLGSEDLTAQMASLTQELSAEQARIVRKAAMIRLQNQCSQESPDTRCEVSELHGGANVIRYRYQRFQDVRLVFAPEASAAYFGGQIGSFTFPRYAFDMVLLRAYEDGKPYQPEHHFPIQAAGAQAQEAVFVTGHPGATQRDLTVAQLETLRDLILPEQLQHLQNLQNQLLAFGAGGTYQKRITQRERLNIENRLETLRGRLQALNDARFMASRQAEEDQLRAAVEAKPEWRESTAEAWNEIALAQTRWAEFHQEYSLIEGQRGLQSDLYAIAHHLVRAAQERDKRNAQRLPEYSDASLPQLTQRLFSASRIDPDLEFSTLSWSLEQMRQQLGDDHPVVKLSLQGRSPAERADELISNTKLTELEQRKALWSGGQAAIDASPDPMIEWARALEEWARPLRQRYQEEIEAVVVQHMRQINQARHALLPEPHYPQANFSLRLSHGRIEGWDETPEKRIEAFSTVAGALARQTGQAPYALPASWLHAESQLDLTQRLNQLSSHDIIGGNSGSPVINRKGELVGLIFDGNVHSLGGFYGYDAARNRAISLHPGALEFAFRLIYPAPRLYRSLFPES